jgi:hypothetical protein
MVGGDPEGESPRHFDQGPFFPRAGQGLKDTFRFFFVFHGYTAVYPMKILAYYDLENKSR